MKNKRFGALSSSEDPNKLGDTVKGIILALSTLIVIVLSKYGITIGTQEVTDFAVGVGTAISQLVILYGIVKKILIQINS